jgi:two-component system sensor histidine kinase HydH
MSTAGEAAWIRAAAVGVATVLIGVVHYAAPASLIHWHYLAQRLYYLPVVYSALCYGWRGGLAASALAAALYLPQVAEDQYLEVLLFAAVGLLTGILADRERRQKQRLGKVYAELQESFDRMKRAERLYALGQLSAGLAHEIRNPLASIAGAAGLLQRRRPPDDAKAAECLDIINKECQRLNRLLTNFLDFARPPAPKYQAMSLGPVVDSVISLAAHGVDRRQVVLKKDIAPEASDFDCDPEQLKQVLLNLVINAIQASEAGGEIVISARVEEGKLRIRVKDQGCGVAPDHFDRLFDPFFTTKKEGTGLGLPVAHQIVTHLGGVLAAHTNPDRGVTFSVTLPLKHGAAK